MVDVHMLGAIDRTYLSHIDYDAYAPELGEYMSDAWFAARLSRPHMLSASRVASVLGVDPNTSVHAAYVKRMDELHAVDHVRVEQNHHMRRGVLAEPVLIDYVRALLKRANPEWRVLANTGIFQRGCISATPDGFVISPAGNVYVLEIKCPYALPAAEGGAVPVRYAPQMLAQMYATGARGAFYFACSPSDGYRLSFMHRGDDHLINHVLLPTCEEFVRRVQAEEEPPARFAHKAVFARAFERVYNGYTLPCGFHVGRMFEVLPEVEWVLHHTALLPWMEDAGALRNLRGKALGVEDAKEARTTLEKYKWTNVGIKS